MAAYKEFKEVWGELPSISPHTEEAPGYTTGRVLSAMKIDADEISALRSQLEEAKEIIRLFSGIPIPEEIETGWDCTNVTLLNCNIRRARSFLSKENGNG